MKEIFTSPAAFFMQVDYNFLEKALKQSVQVWKEIFYSQVLVHGLFSLDSQDMPLSWFPFCITDGCYPSPFLVPLFISILFYIRVPWAQQMAKRRLRTDSRTPHNIKDVSQKRRTAQEVEKGQLGNQDRTKSEENLLRRRRSNASDQSKARTKN